MAVNLVEEKTLRCSRCELHLPVSSFARCKSLTRGYSYLCKECKRPENRKSWHKYYKSQDNREKHNAYHAQHHLNNPDYRRQAAHIRRVRMRGNGEIDRTITTAGLYARDGGICQICKCVCSEEDASVDHIVAVARGGTHTWDNVQLAHLTCNKKKFTKTPEEMNSWL